MHYLQYLYTGCIGKSKYQELAQQKQMGPFESNQSFPFISRSSQSSKTTNHM